VLRDRTGNTRAARTLSLRRSRRKRKHRFLEAGAAIHFFDQVVIVESLFDYDAAQALLHGFLRDGRERHQPLCERMRRFLQQARRADLIDVSAGQRFVGRQIVGEQQHLFDARRAQRRLEPRDVAR